MKHSAPLRMRCAKICIVLLPIGIGVAAVLAYTGNVKAAFTLTYLPLLACPLMCVVMMMTGRTCADGACHPDQKKDVVPSRTHVEK